MIMNFRVKVIAAPLGLSEYECTDGKVFLDKKVAEAHQVGLDNQMNKLKKDYQTNIDPKESYDLIEILKTFDGAIDYDGSASSQVYFELKNGKRLRFMVCDSDVGNDKLRVDQYEGLAIIGQDGKPKNL